MAKNDRTEEDRSFARDTASSNRAQMQGLGAGRKEMDQQQAPSRDAHATDPQRTEPFDQSLEGATNADRPSEADFSGQEPGQAGRPAAAMPGAALDDRNAAGLGAAGDLGAGTPAGVDIHDTGEDDNPQAEWGEEADEGAIFSSNHSRKGVRTDAERGQGAKTRQMTKDIISRRST